MDALDFMVDRDQHMRPLEYDLSENLNALLRYMQDMGILDNVPVGTTSESEIVSISDAYPAPPRALTVYGKSTQAGTPTPDAPVPILSVDDLSLLVAGKNLANNDKSLAGYLTSTGEVTSLTNWYHTGLIPVTGGATYYVSGLTANTTSAYFIWRDAAESVISSHTYNAVKSVPIRTAPDNARYAQISYKADDTQLQFETGSTATAYEPYQGTTVPDLLPEGTELRYLDSTVRDRLDLSYLRPSERDGYAWYSRKLVTRVGERQFQDGNFTWYASSGGAMGFRRSLTGSLYTGSRTVCRSNRLPYANEAANYGCYIRHSEFGFNPQDLTDIAPSGLTAAGLTEFNEWNLTHPINVIYRLASPVTTQLDPIELPTLPSEHATVWCDGGSAQPSYMMEYVKDTNIVIADLMAALADLATS